MAPTKRIGCRYCDKVFARKEGLTQHLQSGSFCSLLQQDEEEEKHRKCAARKKSNHPTVPDMDDVVAIFDDLISAHSSKRSRTQAMFDTAALKGALMEDAMAWDELDHKNNKGSLHRGGDKNSLVTDKTKEAVHDNTDELDLMGVDLETDSEEEDTIVPMAPMAVAVDSTSRQQFQEYCDTGKRCFLPFTSAEVSAIRLLNTLRRKKCSLDSYDSILEWHFETTGELRRGGSIGDCSPYLSRYVLLPKLMRRYNLEALLPKEMPIRLPSSNSKANVIVQDTEAGIQSLLTDPRRKDEDYLFHNDDPFLPPPADLNVIGDLNTGTAFLESHKKLVVGPKDVPMALVLEIDGTVTGQFDNCPITAMKMSLGIFTRKCRDKDDAWTILGFVPKIHSDASTGDRMFVESGHMAATETAAAMLQGEGVEENAKISNMQDYHNLLEVVLDGLAKLQQKGGFLWDLRYKGQVFKDVHFIPYISHLRVDEKEASSLCGRYGSYTKGVKSYCHNCTCPSEESDNPDAKFQFKTPKMINRLARRNDEDALNAMSQHNINNAFHKLDFGKHNNRGIHGACPSEMLHAILLGLFLYCRSVFFEQIGPSSKAAKAVNALAKLYGKLFQHQSDRDMPRTKFAKGIQAGKLMAKQHRGILLIMAAILRCSRGRQILAESRKGCFNTQEQIRDWVLLVETLLEWEHWLCSEEMDRSVVVRMKGKNKFIMHLLKRIANRTKGLGWNIVKFHNILHIWEDILMFGIPLEFDTGSAESGHKVTKTAAKTTQRNQETFDLQTANRLLEYRVVDMAMEELDGRPLWNYFDGFSHRVVPEKPQVTCTGGSAIEVSRVPGTASSRYSWCITSRVKNKDSARWNKEVVFFLGKLQDLVIEKVGKLKIRTQHKRNGLIFRGNPFYRRTIWRDWVLVDYGRLHGQLPTEIWCFLDFSELKPGTVNIEYGGMRLRDAGVYAVVEVGYYSHREDEIAKSGIFRPFSKETKRGTAEDGGSWKRQFYLVDVEAFVEPMVVVPDVGGKRNAYFHMKSRQLWVEQFEQWVKDPHSEL